MSWVSANALSACIAPMRFQQLAGINILSFRILRILIPQYYLNFILPYTCHQTHSVSQGHE